MIYFDIWIIFLLYAVSLVFYIRNFIHKRPEAYRQAQIWLGIALVAHTGFLIYMGVITQRLPVATVSEAISTFVWLTVITYWTLEKRLKEPSLGAFMLPFVLIFLVVSNLTYDPNPVIAEVLKNVTFELHVMTILLAYGAFAISFLASLLHTLLDREIQKRQLGVFYSRLPSLPFFERISNYAIDIGLVFSAISFVIGYFLAQEVWGNFLLSDPKFIAAFVTWLIYFVHFLGRKFFGWRGQRAATISLAGFLWLLFSFMVISTFFTRVHHFV